MIYDATEVTNGLNDECGGTDVEGNERACVMWSCLSFAVHNVEEELLGLKKFKS